MPENNLNLQGQNGRCCNNNSGIIGGHFGRKG